MGKERINLFLNILYKFILDKAGWNNIDNNT